MHNEIDLTLKHFNKKEIASRRDLWGKIELLEKENEELKSSQNKLAIEKLRKEKQNE